MIVDESDPRYHCCRAHVHSFTVVIAVIGILLNLAAAVANIKTHSYYYTSGIVSIICYVLLIIGNRTNSRIFYWPHMIFNTLAIIAYFVFGIIMFVLFINLKRGVHYDWMKDYDRDDIKVWSVITGCIFIVVAAIQIICWVIIYKDYIYVRDINRCPPPRIVNAPVVFQQPQGFYAQPHPQVIHVVNTNPHCHGNVYSSHCD